MADSPVARPSPTGRFASSLSSFLTAVPAAALSFLLAAAPAYAARPVAVQTVDRTGTVRAEPVPAGAGIFRVTVEGRPEHRVVVDPAAPLRVLIEFDAPPGIVARASGRIGPTAAMRAVQLRSDLARIAATMAGAARDAHISREYREVWSGAAAEIAPGLLEPLRRLPYVRRVVPDDTVHATLTESVHLIRADLLRQTTGATGAGIRVGIVDTGIDYSHPAFGNGYGPGHRVAGGYDFANDDADPRDDHGHGTHVAGIVGGNGGGVVGVAPGVTLYAFKVLTAGGWGYESWILAGLERALDPDGDPGTDDAMQVINLSLGSSAGNPDDPMSLALDHLTESGVVCCVAAGNDGSYRSIGSPGTSRRAITVGATDKQDSIAFFSSRGPVPRTYDAKPDLMAPGVDIVSSMLGGGTIALSGTSMAAPHVTGCAALLLQLHPAWTPDDVKSALTSTAHALARTPLDRGSGRVDALDAAAAAVSFMPTQLAFGRMPVTTGPDWVRTDTLHVRNLGASTSAVTFPATTTVAPGAILRCSPAAVTLAPGESGVVLATLTADPAIPPPHDQPFGFATMLDAVCDGRTYRIPVTFFRHGILALKSDAFADWTFVEDHATREILYGGWPPGLDQIPVAPGDYDVTTSFYPFYRLVSHEVTVLDSTVVAISAGEATATQSFAYLDREGHPFESDTGTLTFHRTGSRFTFAWAGFPITPIATSPDRPDYELCWTYARSDGASSWISVSDTQKGITGDAVHSKPGAVWRAFTMSLPPPAEPDAAEIFWVYSPFLEDSPDSYFGVGYSPPRDSLPHEFHCELAMDASGASLRGLAVDFYPRDSSSIVWNRGPLLLSPRLRVDRWPLESYLGVMLGQPMSRFSGTRMRLFGLPVWRGLLYSGPGLAYVSEGGTFFSPHVWTDGWGAVRTEPDPSYELLCDGITAANGTLVGAGGFTANQPAAVTLPPSGVMDLRLHREDVHSGVAWGTAVSARFDPQSLDRDPPWLRSFQVQAGGEEADTVDFTRNPGASLRFRLSDATAITPLIELHAVDGGPWVPVPVTRDADEYVAALPATFEGAVDLRLTATDAQLNALAMTWSPAFVSVPAGSAVPVGPDGRPLLHLDGAIPNPARAGAVVLRLTLPDSAPADLEVLDVAGRRVASRTVGSLGAGRHRVTLTPGQPMRPGIYFARLRRAGVQQVTRFCVVN